VLRLRGGGGIILKQGNETFYGRGGDCENHPIRYFHLKTIKKISIFTKNDSNFF